MTREQEEWVRNHYPTGDDVGEAILDFFLLLIIYIVAAIAAVGAWIKNRHREGVQHAKQRQHGPRDW